MQTASPLEQTSSPQAPADTSESSGAGKILFAVFEALDRAGIAFCVLHGYADYPQAVRSDVDCLIDRNVSPAQLLALLHENRGRIGAEVVLCRGYYLVLAGKAPDGSPTFLTLDFGLEYELEGFSFYAGAEVLENRRRHGRLWIPAPHMEFGGYLLRTIFKGRLDEERTQRLSSLFRQDPAGCEQQVERFWEPGSAALIGAAAGSGDWRQVGEHLGPLRAEMRRRAALRHPARLAGKQLRSFAARLRRLLQPDGMDIVLLGPDGAGKSSTIAALEEKLAPAFARSVCWGFAPPLFRRLRQRGPVSTSEPHALRPRSYPTSVLRAAYWFVYYTLGYCSRHLALTRTTLVLNDRHFVDIFVDRTRYRYGGPSWLLRLIWRLIPKPDLIVLLDAPAEVLQARKQEVPFEETSRQRTAYLSLMGTLRNGYIADATKPLDQVCNEISDVVLRRLAMRVASRFGVPHSAAARNLPPELGEVGRAAIAGTRET